jgi:uncharacterized membrane protein
MSSSDESKKMAAESSNLPVVAQSQANPKINVDGIDGRPATESSPNVMRASFSAEMYSGPIPPPSIMAEWEKLLPGSADRILTMAENQSAHRISMEEKVVDGDVRRSDRGLIFGFITALVMIIGGLVVIGLGHDFAGAAVITGSLVGVVGLFVYAYITREAERKSRQNAAAAANQITIPTPPKSTP